MMQEDIKTIYYECPICRSNAYRNVEKHKARGFFSNTKLITCGDCLTKSVYPMPSDDELDKINQRYWTIAKNTEYHKEHFFNQTANRIQYLKTKLGQIEDLKVLDVGSGPAFLFDILKRLKGNINYTAIETDLKVQKMLKSKGITNIYQDWKDISGKSFDLIVLSHIIEHFNKPMLYLGQIISLLRTNGYIYIELPNSDDAYKNNLGLHLLIFNPYSLQKMLELLKLNLLCIDTYGSDIGKVWKTKIINRIKWEINRHFPIFDKVFKKFEGTRNGEFIQRNDLNGRWLRAIAQKTR